MTVNFFVKVMPPKKQNTNKQKNSKPQIKQNKQKHPQNLSKWHYYHGYLFYFSILSMKYKSDIE